MTSLRRVRRGMTERNGNWGFAKRRASNLRGVEQNKVLKMTESSIQIDVLSKLHALDRIRRKLTETQKHLFRKQRFRYFLDLQPLTFQATLVHSVLLRMIENGPELRTTNELWFSIDEETTIRFSEGDFAKMTGLEVGNPERFDCKLKTDSTNSILDRLEGLDMKTFDVIIESIDFTEEDDTVAVKIALVYVLERVLMGNLGRTKIAKERLRLVDNLDEFNKYPWGTVSYKKTIESLQKAGRTKQCRYSLCGFPYAFQIWLYEISPFIAKTYAEKIVGSENIPCMFKWAAKTPRSYAELKKAFDEKGLIPDVILLEHQKIENVNVAHHDASTSTAHQSENDDRISTSDLIGGRPSKRRLCDIKSPCVNLLNPTGSTTTLEEPSNNVEDQLPDEHLQIEAVAPHDANSNKVHLGGDQPKDNVDAYVRNREESDNCEGMSIPDSVHCGLPLKKRVHEISPCVNLPTKVKLTLVVNKSANKVIFAEAGKDFVDILFNILCLPISTIIRFGRNASTFGCIENLYKSLEHFDEAYLVQNQKRDILLKPNVLHILNVLSLKVPEASCDKLMREEFEKCEASAGEEGTVKNLFTYMVTDDLSVTPLSMTSGIVSMLLDNLSVLEKRLVELSNDEVLELLENAMNSRTALTSVFLK